MKKLLTLRSETTLQTKTALQTIIHVSYIKCQYPYLNFLYIKYIYDFKNIFLFNKIILTFY